MLLALCLNFLNTEPTGLEGPVVGTSSPEAFEKFRRCFVREGWR